MRTLFSSDFFLRFAGGFALGAVAMAAMQPGAVVQTLASIAAPIVTHVA